MVKIDASEYETNWLTDSPEKEGQPSDPGESSEANSTPTEESQAQQTTKALNSALDSTLSKDEWIPYEGPKGGEGWQNAGNRNDVRYQEDAPGEIAEGYEQQAEGWGTPENWFTDRLQSGELAPVSQIEEDSWYNIDGEITEIRSVYDDYILTNDPVLGVENGIVVAEKEFDNVIQGSVQFLEFSEDSEFDDGWYDVAEDWEVVSAPSGGNEYAAEITNAKGETQTAGMHSIEGRRRPVPVEQATPEMDTPWEKYNSNIPDSDSIPESFEIGDMDRLTDSQIDHIQNGLTKADSIGLLNHAESIQQYAEDSMMLQVRDVIASYAPGDRSLRVNPDEFSEERISDGHERGRFVAEDRSEIIMHEAMHVAHAQNLGSMEEAKEMINTDLSQSEMTTVVNSISRYAAENPMELVAEVGLKILKGEKVPDGALWAYEKFQGPDL